jgi:hypothetical protein
VHYVLEEITPFADLIASVGKLQQMTVELLLVFSLPASRVAKALKEVCSFCLSL